MAVKRTKIINKQNYKQTAKSCRICKQYSPELLDVHRIIPGCDGGKYSESNVVALCVVCHRKVHITKTIEIDRWYFSTGGYLLRIIEDGVEKFV